ncbi:glycoside hydrolase family 13 protein [Candidatus Enterococcus leclercqii]|uniref:glycoside hydrolase family 13 protein n=1 Tax=Candidatus Enterococcus leclercqii TaxID=1857218 RepID=UPI0013797A24|nr:alpha-glucosidase [Enterococcus sp. CU9D]KAF1292680.1 glucohydrolase [Enterococcus sp. CU9D]
MIDTLSWWKNAVGYQIYPRSFMDSDGDGIGDINGIIEKLPYIKSLGVDFIWLNPIYKSPNVDNGYDISDYQDIQQEYGTMAQFKELLAQVHQAGMKLILDLVINHTSDQHPWFLEAKKGVENPYRNYYHWQSAAGEKQPPNEWQSFFGGPTWTYDATSKESYFHVFAPQQPDLNWTNFKVREEIYAMIEWWLELGIDGFRLDAISHIQKESWDFKITDNPWAPFMNVSGIEEYMAELKGIFARYDIMTVGEASGVSSRRAVDWTDDEGYINMIFELEHNVREGKPGAERINLLGFKKVLARWQKHLEHAGWNALYVENHDNPRFNSVLGNETAKSAQAIGTAYMLLKGTPFVYQGQELGMTNYPFTGIDQVDAKDSHNHYRLLLEEGTDSLEALKLVTHWTRDHSRTPMQWSSAVNAGFTTGQPWLAVNPNYPLINAAVEEADPDSALQFYRRLIAFRKAEPVFTTGSFDLVAAGDPDIFAYVRQTEEKALLVLVNLSQHLRVVTLPNRLIATGDQNYRYVFGNLSKQAASRSLTKQMRLAPYDAAVFEHEK